MESGKEKEECGDREEAKSFGNGSVATRFTAPKVLFVLLKKGWNVQLYVDINCADALIDANDVQVIVV